MVSAVTSGFLVLPVRGETCTHPSPNPTDDFICPEWSVASYEKPPEPEPWGQDLGDAWSAEPPVCS